MSMERRKFLSAGAGVAGAALAAPAIAQSQPTIRWRMATSWPKSLDTLYGGAEMIGQRVAALTEGRFQIRAFAGGEVVPALQVLDAVQAGTVECGHTANYYYIGKNTACAFDTALPFGLTARQQNSWMYYGGGMAAMREVFDQFNAVPFPAGNTGTQMGGWFRREVNSLADLKGLKMRIPGLGGRIMAALGATPQTIAGGEIYQALERGTIDATEWVGPYDDEKLGFFKVAKFYYAPGWWEPGAQVSLIVNKGEWEKLPKLYQEALASAAKEVNMDVMSEYDQKNALALTRLVRNGVQLRTFPNDMMIAAQNAAFELYAEESGKNPLFKKVFDGWRKFREEQYNWLSTADSAFERFVYANKKL
jgi:TRAP-type mannitol/chloroaromatic compound transport system substrate-binding protein